MNVDKQFLAEISKPGDRIDIEYCALLFSSRLQDSVSVLETPRILDDQVNDFLTSFPEFAESHAFNAEYLTGVVGEVLGYRGDNVEYFSPENSLLDRVVSNRLGIPISLAAIYFSVGKRLGMTVHGINFPGHFLIRVMEPDNSARIVDPFANRVLTKSEVEALVRSARQSFGFFKKSWMENAHPHDVLMRMLENLKSVYSSLENVKNALVCLDFQLMIKPEEPLFLEQASALRASDPRTQTGGSSLN
jgi:regulator of sirC expression with transglutaminase-like and TPR domain